MNVVAIPAAAQKLIAAIEKLSIDGMGAHPKYEPTPCSPHVFYIDGQVKVSGEHDQNGQLWMDYYGGYMRGMCWVNPVLEAWAKANGGYWEWDNPGCISFISN